MRYLAVWALFAALAVLPLARAQAATLPADSQAATNSAATYSHEDIQQMLQDIDQRIQADKADIEDGYLLSTLAGFASKEQLNEIALLRSLLDIQAENYGLAISQLEILAGDTNYEKALYCRELACLLQEHPDGQYQRSQTKPAEKLSDPAVLRYALASRAANTLRDSLKLLQQASALPQNNLNSREELYGSAYDLLITAETLRSGCATRYIKQVAGIRIAILKERTELLAAKFDLDMKIIGKKELPRPQYAKLLTGMLATLDAVAVDLETITDIAADTPQEFAVEMEWAASDLGSIARMRKTITTELDQINIQTPQR